MKRILLAMTGGIAAYKCCELVRLLIKSGYDVKVIMTRSAQEFVTPLTMRTLSRNPVYCELFADSYDVQHISLARWADLMLIAPATANIIGKMANGIADDLLTSVYFATTAPVFIAPAMNVEMWRHNTVQANIDRLVANSVKVIGPGRGEMAEQGECGDGRMAEPAEIFSVIEESVMINKTLTGKKVVITAGPTQEEVDPVRYISNRSSGKMGYALAGAFVGRGAEVILVSGPVNLEVPEKVKLVNVKTALEMRAAVFENIEGCAIFVGVAAVADYRPSERQPEKIKKAAETMTLQLVKNPDILAEVASRHAAGFIAGFAAETFAVESQALEKLRRKNIDIIVANDVSDGAVFGQDENSVTVYGRNGFIQSFGPELKTELAGELADCFVEQAFGTDNGKNK